MVWGHTSTPVVRPQGWGAHLAPRGSFRARHRALPLREDVPESSSGTSFFWVIVAYLLQIMSSLGWWHFLWSPEWGVFRESRAKIICRWSTFFHKEELTPRWRKRCSRTWISLDSQGAGSLLPWEGSGGSHPLPRARMQAPHSGMAHGGCGYEVPGVALTKHHRPGASKKKKFHLLFIYLYYVMLVKRV